MVMRKTLIRAAAAVVVALLLFGAGVYFTLKTQRIVSTECVEFAGQLFTYENETR